MNSTDDRIWLQQPSDVLCLPSRCLYDTRGEYGWCQDRSTKFLQGRVHGSSGPKRRSTFRSCTNPSLSLQMLQPRRINCKLFSKTMTTFLTYEYRSMPNSETNSGSTSGLQNRNTGQPSKPPSITSCRLIPNRRISQRPFHMLHLSPRPMVIRQEDTPRS